MQFIRYYIIFLIVVLGILLPIIFPKEQESNQDDKKRNIFMAGIATIIRFPLDFLMKRSLVISISLIGSWSIVRAISIDNAFAQKAPSNTILSDSFKDFSIDILAELFCGVAFVLIVYVIQVILLKLQEKIKHIEGSSVAIHRSAIRNHIILYAAAHIYPILIMTILFFLQLQDYQRMFWHVNIVLLYLLMVITYMFIKLRYKGVVISIIALYGSYVLGYISITILKRWL